MRGGRRRRGRGRRGRRRRGEGEGGEGGGREEGRGDRGEGEDLVRSALEVVPLELTTTEDFAALAHPVALGQPGAALSTTGSGAGPAANNSKIVIARLAATVTTLNAELAAKTSENGASLLA